MLKGFVAAFGFLFLVSLLSSFPAVASDQDTLQDGIFQSLSDASGEKEGWIERDDEGQGDAPEMEEEYEDESDASEMEEEETPEEESDFEEELEQKDLNEDEQA